MRRIFCFAFMFFASFAANGQEAAEVRPAVDETAAVLPEEQSVRPEVAAFMEKAEKNRPHSFSYTLEINEPDKTRTVGVYQKNDKVRMEFRLFGGMLSSFAESVFISDGTNGYVYMPKINIATKASSKSSNTTLNFKTLDLTGFELGEKTVKNGFDCRMLYHKEKGSEVCVSEQYGLPVYGKDGDTVSNVTSVKKENINDSLFKLPAEVSVF